MTTFNEQQRAELRDAAARSRIEANDESRRLAAEYVAEKRARREAIRLTPTTKITALDIAGELAETLTALEIAAADLDDDVLSGDVHVLRLRLTKVGNRLARMRGVR